MSDAGAKNLAQLFNALDVPRAGLAVVSPCSQCSNQRSEPKDGKPACPRRAWKKYIGDLQTNGGVLGPGLDLVQITGTSGDALANPVYSDDQHVILVWAAHLRDNMGVLDEQGNVVTPQILDPGFNTDFIKCNPNPYVVRDTEANYFLRGAYREFDTLEAVSVQNQHQAPGNDGSFAPLPIEGYAQRVDFVYRFNRQKVEMDLTPRGT
jgi:hypothetical protein